MTNRLVVIASAVAIMLASCSSSDLTRGGAEEIIEASEKVRSQVPNVIGNSDFIAAGEKQGLWTIEKRNILLSTRAAEEISQINGSRIVPVKPFSINVEITGITEDASSKNVKTAEFTWKYENISPLVRRLSISGGNGVAVFQMYDDGWRLKTVDLKPQDQPAELSVSEQGAIEADITAEAERKATEARAMHALWSGGEVHRTLYFTSPESATWFKTDFTDNAMVSYYRRNPTGPWQLQSSYWFGVMSQPGNQYSGSGSRPGQIRLTLWRPHGVNNNITRSYGTMGLPVDEFLSILNSYRNRWRTANTAILDGDYVKYKYSEVYNALHTGDGIKNPEAVD